MAFLHQLRLLLWKNGLAVIRQPLWSLTLIIWPLVIFIIIAVTRHQFPPIVKPPCYVGPRNLPSTGFFPFLQTLMCNTDSHCHNTSRLVDPAATRSSRTTSRQRLSAAKLFQGEEILNFPLAAGQRGAPGALLGFLENITGLHQGGRHHNASFITFNTTLLEDNETLHAMLESVNMLKQAICPMMLPKINNNQTTRPLSFAVVTFCTTNETMLEVSLNTLNQVLIEMMLTRPDELATLAGMAVVVFDQLQNQTSLWESLLAIPQLFHSGSVDEVLDNAENLLTNLQSTLTAIQSKFPETEAPLSAISPIFAISLSVIDYAQDWPGRGVSIPLGELVKVEEDFLSEMVQKVLYGVHIPLDKVIALTLDPDTLNRYVCNNSNNPLWLTAACSTGTVRMLFDWVDSDKAAKQSLLAWSKHVAPRDLSFAKWLLNTLMGEFSPGVPEGPHTPRTRRSVETQPQNIDEELFLWVGEVVLEILHMIPEADKVVQSMLRSGFQSMEIAKLSLETLGGIMDSVLKDASHLKQTYQMLVTDSSKASVWISDVLDSGMEAILMIVASEEATCEDVLSPFEWLLNSETITMEVLRSAICRSDADLQQALLMGLMPLIESAQDFNSTIMGQTDSNVTLPMILSEWQRLYNISQQLLLSVDRLAMELGGAYWMNWMPDNCTHDATGTLQQSVFLFMVKLGGRLERSELWRVVKNYFHMADWVLNYQPGVSTPLNCSVDVYTADVCCHIEKPFNWSQFLTSVTHTLVYLDQHVLVNSLKGTVNLLQHVYSDALNSMVGSFLEHNIHGGEALTHFLINMVHNLQDVVEKISMLPDENITNPNHVGALVSNLFQSSGLSPLLPLLFGDGPVNVSTVLHVATELIKQNQLIVTFNETDPTMPEVEQLIKQFLSLEGNLTMSLSNFMGHSLITYVSYLHPDHVAQIMELIQPFTKQTSAGIVQAIIRAMELLQTVTDAPDGDPTNIILGYIHQLQDFAVSLFRLRRVQKYMLPNGELSASQITDLHILTKEFVDLLSPEGLQRLISAGPDAAQNMVAQKLIDFLPTEAQQEAARLLQDFRILQHYVAKLAAGQDCLKGISEIFTFLNQILDILLTANGNVAIKIAVPNFLHMDQQYEEIACIMFPLLLPPNEAGYLKTFKQAIHFVKLIMATPNITVSGVHNALQQSNLTLEELKNLTSLFGAVDTDDLMARLMDVINSQKCFEPQHSQMVTAQCVLGLVNGVTRFLTQLPGLQNETAILNLIPLIVNNTIKDVGHVDFTNPNAAVIQTLNRTLANVKMGLQVKQLYTPEIMKEIRVLEGLIHLAADPEPFDDIFNSTMTENPMYAQKMYLEMLDWYLKKLENVISHSSLSDLLHPFFKLTQMQQVSLQLAQTEFTLFVSNQIEQLMGNIQHPINGTTVSKIGNLAVEMFQRLFQLIKGDLELQSSIPGLEPFLNTTILNAVELQIKQNLDMIQKWMNQPAVSLILANMLQWGDPYINVSSPFTDLHHLVQTMFPLFNAEQLTYLSIIRNITHSLSNALQASEQPHGINGDQFTAAIMEAVQNFIKIVTAATQFPLPPHLEQNILDIVNNSLKLIFQQDMNYDSSRIASIHILEGVESLIQQILPDISEYLLPGIKIVTTYFESSLVASGPENWNQLILNEMITVQSLLPLDSPAQVYVSTLINITHFILESGRGNMSLWALFESASADSIPMIIGKMGKLLGMLWPIITGHPGPSLQDFAHLAPILEQVMTGMAGQDTWDKLENILEALLSFLKGTELWDTVSSLVPLFEKIIENLVKNMQAENVMVLSLQGPMVTLMTEIVHTVNSSHCNLTEVSERMQAAIEHTVQAAQQANGTLECSAVLKVWDPVREAAGLSHQAMAVWCTIAVQPVLEAYYESPVVYSNLNMSHMNMGPMTVDATAERIVKTLQSIYQVSLNRSYVAQDLIMAFSSHLSMLTGRPLSAEAQLHWLKQLQKMQMLNSLSSLRMLTDRLLMAAPSLQPYIEAVEKAAHYVLSNYHEIQDSGSSEDVFEEAVMIFLYTANITSDNIFSMMKGNHSLIDEATLTNMTRQAARHLMKMFEEVPMAFHGLEHFLESIDLNLVMEKLAEMVAWLASTEAYAMDLLAQTLPELYHILRPLTSAFYKVCMDVQKHMELFEDFADNLVEMVKQFVSTGGHLGPENYHHGMYGQEMSLRNHTKGVRHKRDAPWMPVMSPMNDLIDFLQIDYHSMFKSLSDRPTPEEIMGTAHSVFANPDLNIVVKGVTSDMRWFLNASREDTIDAAVEMLSFFTLPRVFDMSAVEILQRAADMLPDGFPFAMMIKQISSTLASESQENLSLMENTLETAAELFQINMSDPRFKKKLDQLSAQLCAVEKTDSVHLLMSDVKPGFLCFTLMPSVQFILKSLTMNSSAVMETMFETIIGDPRDYDVNSNWTSMLSQGLSFNISSLNSLDIDVSPQAVTVGEMLRDEAAFIQDVQQHMDFDPAALRLLMDTPLPDSNLMILTWLVSLRHCNSKSLAEMEEKDAMIYNSFCPMSVDNWYSFSLLMARHLHTEKLIYKMVLSEELQSMVGVMLQVVELIDRMARTILPAISQLQSHLGAIEDLDLIANDEFHQMSRGLRSNMSTKATFVTLSRALCSNGILALFGISKLPLMADDSSPSSPFDQKREDMIKRFKIPRDASPFCMNMYLDMVNTTGGAIAWAFLKPMLMGQILFTPDTPVTRDIMKKSNATLEELANLRKHSREWLDSSHYILKSAEILSYTLPMLQNSLGNSFVKNFIEMQTDINVDTMKETLSNFSNMTLLLEKNKQILTQITTLSTLMVNLSSCIKFDRYRGYNSAEQLDADAQELAKNRDLYASVIFKLPKDSNSSRKRREATSSLPPKVSYTIRMHMDNVMRTDRVRNPFFIRATHISARMTMRYNRGFVYMQENIDRAIIAAHAGQTVAEPAVQLQPFPYPCHHRDEYLESISYVFPLMLMLAWVLFVADFVKRLVYERELRLHEYMKMMGVNPLSHFFAWFIECALYLFLTIFILTLVLKYGSILPNSDGFLLFLYLCNYGLSILAFSYLVSSIFDKTFIAALSGSLLYILFFFPFIVVMAVETTLTFTQKSILSLFSPTCFSYASQYISRYEAQREGIQWSNIYKSPIAGDEASFGWLCWLMLIDSILYFLIGAYIRMVLPGKYGIPAPWYFPFKASFWAELCCCAKSDNKTSRGLLFTNIMQKNPSVFSDDKGKGQSALSSQDGEDFSHLPVGVTLHSLSKLYGDRVAIQNLNVSFYEGHVTSLLGHNGAGKTTTMSLLTGLFAPTSGTIEVYGRDMQTHTDDVRKELGVCMQYDVLFDHMTTKEHLLLYGQIKAPQWSKGELREQIRTILEETGMYAHRHKRVGTLSGGMKRKLSISIAFIGGSRLVVLDEPTTGVDPCSRRSIWDIIIQYKKHRTIIMSTHHLDEAEVLSDRITFLERGGLKCCGSPFHLKDKLGQGYKLTLTKKMQNQEKQIDNAELKSFIQAHVPEARLKEAQGGDLVYSLPPFSSSNASSYRSLLTALDSNLDALQLGGYGVSDTTLEEVFLQLAQDDREPWDDDTLPSVSEKVSDTGSMDSFPSDSGSISSFNDNIKLTGSTMVRGMALAWQQLIALLTKRFHHCRRDWKGLISQILLPVLFMMAAMGLGSIKSDLQHYPELELSPALYRYEPSYSFFSNSNPNSEQLIDTMLSSPGIDNECLNNPNNPVCSRNTSPWRSSGNSSKAFRSCKCTRKEQICESDNYQPPHRGIPSSQIVYNLSGINVENYLVSTANDFIRNRYGGFAFGMPLPRDLKMDIQTVPKNRTLSKVWFNPEGHHTMPAYLNSINNFILRANLPADKDPRKYAISVSSHPYFGRADDEDTILQGMLQILVAMCVMTGYSITTASFVIYVVSEHHTGSKRLQHIAGISESFYWVVNFCFDMVMYMIPVALTVAVVAAFQVPAFTYRQNLGAVTLLLVLFGFSTFPWMYLLSGIFKDAEMAFITYVCINLFLSVNTIMSTSILYFLSQLSTINPEIVLAVFHRMCNAFLIFPQFTFGHGLMQLARKNAEVQLLSGYGVDAYINPFTMEGLGWLFISSFIQGVVLFSLRLLLNKFIARKVRRLICGRKTVPYVSHEEVDEDVATEHQRVASGAAGSDILQVNQLTKVYQSFSKKVQAVKRVSVGIPAGECFGLLGVNGAGKTTTFKMLTGDVSPTAGTAQIRDQDGRLVDIMACRNQGINIGYCPQVDALDNLLTGEEHLYFYARIRGISKREIDRVVRYLLKRLELNYHRNITTEGYSCGTRRKLSTALALIGNPQILLLDEPSSGMDPRTKRHLWKIISEEVKGKCAVVLTSHSMEECEALCSRLAIMVKGQFRCLGSLQHIKNRFGSGFTVKMYLAEASCDAEAITGFMQRRFPSTYLKDQHSNMVEFHVPVAPGGVADIFDQLESNKSALRIKHFSVSQTTLDEVFINFAMENTDNMENISINNEDGSDSDSMSSISAAAT
ncbi:ATP-binding cassette sub-family A member 12 [Cheilinus undulatus]|uniref:ATP-binding cassette sub-family A member 12 n=1 Tax=Cheilinus undulatus TaxID=241271 RepID=UPI001BD28B2B|nr:ATP-binding cassette sub-family A member 12 [Cheilinus undulatus]